MKSARFSVSVAAVSWCMLAGCTNTPQAVGTVSSIIVITTDSLWAEIGDSVMRALEPRIFAVRNERAFEVTQVAPTDPQWTELREFRHVLVIGTPQDGWVAPVLERARAESVTAPDVIQTRDVWARNQFATAIVIPPEQSAAAALSQSGRAALLTDSVFRAYVRGRMFTSKPDTLLRDSLRASAGFSIVLPQVYGSVLRSTDTHLFQNSTQIGGDLVRSILITARPGLLQPAAPEVVAWRDSVAATYYRPAQNTVRDPVQTRPLQLGEHAAIEVQGVWEGNDPNWPMAGPFITRAVTCPAQNRTYLLDSWLYSPSGQRGSKYEYMIQLQTILDSFECAGAAGAG